MFNLAGAPISWEARKQVTVALSSTEAEYMALSESTKEAIYLRRILKELKFKNSRSKQTTIYCGNQGDQKLVQNPVYHARTKHIDIRHHFVRGAYEKGLINLLYISTKDMIADVMTKALNGPTHAKFITNLIFKN